MQLKIETLDERHAARVEEHLRAAGVICVAMGKAVATDYTPKQAVAVAEALARFSGYTVAASSYDKAALNDERARTPPADHPSLH